MRKSLFPIALLAFSVLAPAFAAGGMKAGLWQMTMQNMPKISAEQAQQLKSMGITLPPMQDGALVTKVCLSKEMAARDEPPVMGDQAGCQSKNYQRSGSTYSVDVACSGPEIQGQGKAKGSMGPDSFTSTVDFQGTMHGLPVSQHHDMSGKWLSANCGDVKPLGDMLPKR